jgi:enoyl-CoA hydratase
MPAVAAHPDAVDLELVAQVWSTQQPFFAERLAQLKERISRK